MLISEIAKAAGHRLTDTDRRLVAALQAQPAEAAFWRAQELTEPLGLHQSAATRLAQRLGFDGYPELRDALRQDYLAGDGPSQRVRGRIAGEGDVLDELVQGELTALAELPRHVAQAELDELAERVLAARRVHLFGQGNATVLVEQLGRRLQRYGVVGNPLTGSRRDLAERAAAIGAGDVVIAFAFRRMPGGLAPLLRLAEAEGAHSVVVTDTLLAMTPRPDRIVAAPRGTGDAFLSLTVPMAISNALVLTIARRAPERALGALDRLGVLLERFEA
ncbi:MAG: MurR/RpiR family transcriptional regulator [Microbacteriaceae bacterium]